MSGVFGVVDPTQKINIHTLTGRMKKEMSRYEWNVIEHSIDIDRNLTIGRIGIGILNKGSQPIWNSSGTVALAMAGEFYNRDEFEMTESGKSDEEIALSLYERLGNKFVDRLAGAFVIVIWDKTRNQLLLVNDRFGLYPTYIAQVGSKFLFAPEVKAVLVDSDVNKSLRDDAIAEYFRFQHLLGHKTFFSGVTMLPPASILTYRYGETTHHLQSYWNLSQAPLLSINFHDAVEEGVRLFRSSVSKMTAGEERIGVFLSGGLDGRAILGMIPSDRGKIHTLTFGQPGCRDEYYARKIAKAAGANHHYFPYENGIWIRELADKYLDETEGFHPWIHMHGFNMLSTVRQYVDVNLSGLGDLLWVQPRFVPRHLVNAPDDIAFNSILFDLYSQRYTWPNITYPEERYLYQESFYDRMNGLAFDSFVNELKPFAHLPYAQRAAAFNLLNHFNRHLLYSGVAGRSHIEYRFPYFDYDLASFCYGLPYEIGYDRLLQRAIIERESPALARIPYEDDELPVSSSRLYKTLGHLKIKLKSAIHKYVLPIYPPRTTLYADYEGWLRTDLKQWAEEILFDDNAQSQEIFRPKMLRSLMDRHLKGHQEWLIGKIAPLITFKMLLKRYFSLGVSLGLGDMIFTLVFGVTTIT